jgi:hypothetical protein
MPLPIKEAMGTVYTRDKTLFVRSITADSDLSFRIIACSAPDFPGGGPSDTVFRVDDEGRIHEDQHTTHALFQTLWTKAVGTATYDKSQWKELEKIIYKNTPPGSLAPRTEKE